MYCSEGDGRIRDTVPEGTLLPTEQRAISNLMNNPRIKQAGLTTQHLCRQPSA